MLANRMEARLLPQPVDRCPDRSQSSPCRRPRAWLGQPMSDRLEIFDRLVRVGERSPHAPTGSASYRPERGGGNSWSVPRLSIQASTASDDTTRPEATDARASAILSTSQTI